jgi:hypothetical protein
MLLDNSFPIIMHRFLKSVSNNPSEPGSYSVQCIDIVVPTSRYDEAIKDHIQTLLKNVDVGEDFRAVLTGENGVMNLTLTNDPEGHNVFEADKSEYDALFARLMQRCGVRD